jgi:hypothetical protein
MDDAGTGWGRTGDGQEPVKPSRVKSLVLCISILLAVGNAVPILWVKLPRLEATALDGRLLVLPDSAAGNIALVGFGYQRESQDDLNSWLKPFRREYMPADGFRAYEVPMMGSRIPGVLRGIINAGMRKATTEGILGSVAPFYGDVDGYSRRLGVDDRSRVQMFLLDGSGLVRWHASGRADSIVFAGLRLEVAKLAAGQY